MSKPCYFNRNPAKDQLQMLEIREILENYIRSTTHLANPIYLNSELPTISLQYSPKPLISADFYSRKAKIVYRDFRNSLIS